MKAGGSTSQPPDNSNTTIWKNKKLGCRRETARASGYSNRYPRVGMCKLLLMSLSRTPFLRYKKASYNGATLKYGLGSFKVIGNGTIM